MLVKCASSIDLAHASVQMLSSFTCVGPCLAPFELMQNGCSQVLSSFKFVLPQMPQTQPEKFMHAGLLRILIFARAQVLSPFEYAQHWLAPWSQNEPKQEWVCAGAELLQVRAAPDAALEAASGRLLPAGGAGALCEPRCAAAVQAHGGHAVQGGWSGFEVLLLNERMVDMLCWCAAPLLDKFMVGTVS
eukprot:scaffold40232_cov21-Tisochrysis_lutea.AAC.4